jgi:hypothetical protein
MDPNCGSLRTDDKGTRSKGVVGSHSLKEASCLLWDGYIASERIRQRGSVPLDAAIQFCFLLYFCNETS